MEDPTAERRVQLDRVKRGLEPAPQESGAPSADLMEAVRRWPTRFSSKVQFGDRCWLWTACKTKLGYGRFRRGGRKAGVAIAHRHAFEMTYGAVPAELVIDHLCRNPSCVRPDHLESVTQKVNMERAATSNVVGWCRRGLHEWTEANQYAEPDGSKRCRPCRQASERAQSPGIAASLRMHCPQQHEYTPGNTRISKSGSRSCKTCHREQELVRYHVRRAAHGQGEVHS